MSENVSQMIEKVDHLTIGHVGYGPGGISGRLDIIKEEDNNNQGGEELIKVLNQINNSLVEQ
jgi:hypothetical protein